MFALNWSRTQSIRRDAFSVVKCFGQFSFCFSAPKMNCFGKTTNCRHLLYLTENNNSQCNRCQNLNVNIVLCWLRKCRLRICENIIGMWEEALEKVQMAHVPTRRKFENYAIESSQMNANTVYACVSFCLQRKRMLLLQYAEHTRFHSHCLEWIRSVSTIAYMNYKTIFFWFVCHWHRRHQLLLPRTLHDDAFFHFEKSCLVMAVLCACHEHVNASDALHSQNNASNGFVEESAPKRTIQEKFENFPVGNFVWLNQRKISI